MEEVEDLDNQDVFLFIMETILYEHLEEITIVMIGITDMTVLIGGATKEMENGYNGEVYLGLDRLGTRLAF